jgi:hypothetical protein
MNITQGLTHTKKGERPTFRRQESIFIEALPEAVFHHVSDLRRHSEWGAQAWNIIPEPGPEHGPGATFVASAHMPIFGRVLGQATIRIVVEESPVRFVFDCIDWSGCHRWSMLLQPEGTGTQLRYQVERLQGPWWMRVFQPILFWPYFGRRYARAALTNIKVLLEADHSTSQKVKRLIL